MAASKHLYSWLALVLVCGLVSGSVYAQSGGTIETTTEVVPGELIVRIKGNSAGDATKRVFGRMKGRARLKRSMNAMNIHHLRISDGTQAEDMIRELNSQADVVYAEPNYVVRLNAQIPSSVPSDNEVLSAGDVQIMSGNYTQDSAPVKVTQAWPYVTANANVPIVAVVDTGIDYNHYVFTATQALWTNTHEIAANGIDDDGNGYIDDVKGWNFAYGNNNPLDDNGHGTHVAGIVIGVGQNILASQASLTTSVIKVMPLKFMDSTGAGTTAQAVAAIYYAVNNGARVINNSWGGSGYSQSLHDALTFAYNNGVFIASAAGNYASNDDSNPLYPASLPIPGQLSVAATDNSDFLASFSSYGASSIPVAAPGVTILSTYPSGQFAYLSGTSMATPFVAGLGALVLHQAPQLTGYQVRQIISQSVDPIARLSGYVTTSGRVNALSTLINATSNVSTMSTQPSYAAVPPAGTSSGATSSSTGGCGTISAGAGGRLFGKDSNGGSGPMPPMMIAILFLPLAVWFGVRRYFKRGYRREHDRFVLNSEVRVKVDGRELIGKLNTIGLGGVSFNADALLDKGGIVTMQIQSPDGGDQIQVAGRIVWSEEASSYGVQFGPVADGILDRIKVWTNSLLKAS